MSFLLEISSGINFTKYLNKKTIIIITIINMVAVVRISKEGNLLEIKEVSDKYRKIPYNWKKSKK